MITTNNLEKVNCISCNKSLKMFVNIQNGIVSKDCSWCKERNIISVYNGQKRHYIDKRK